MRLAPLALLLGALTAPLAAEPIYRLRDQGKFMPRGQPIEFADRFGWKHYEADLSFGLVLEERALSRDSRLSLKVIRKDSKAWSFTCKARNGALQANINLLIGKGISVVMECPIPPKEFSKAVNMDPQDVGEPRLVFQAMVRDGQVGLGPQRGIALPAVGQAEATELGPYLASPEDSGGLSVIFRSLND
ncbi:MAG: hypothetical protein HY921_08560 [Elusimicrobia bacterium]|nr:hypothetical protein [Elusimicrobiota bacterium]